MGIHQVCNRAACVEVYGTDGDSGFTVFSPCVVQEQLQVTVSACRNVITNGLFNPSHMEVSGSSEAAMHLMPPEATTEASYGNSTASPTPPVPTHSPAAQPLILAPHPNTADGEDDANPESVSTADTASFESETVCAVMPPPTLESEPSNCELRDALTLAVQQRDTAVNEMHAVAQCSTAALAEVETLRGERDEAFSRANCCYDSSQELCSQVVELRRELAQSERVHQEREREHHEKLLVLQARVSEVEALRTSATNAILEASSLRKTLSSMRLKGAQSGGGLPRSSRISRGVSGAIARTGQLIGRVHGTGIFGRSVSSGPRWLKGSASSNNVASSQHNAGCAYNCM